MNQSPTPLTHSQAINAVFSMIARLSRLVLWTLIALAHLALLVLALAACWLMGVTAADVTTAYLRMRQTMPVEVLSFVGVSAGTLLAAWLWMMRKVHTASAGTWLTTYLMKGL